MFALGIDGHAVVSQHMGDLDHLEALRQFERDIVLYEQLFQVKPELIVHDLHPDYASTGYAMRRAVAEAIPRVAVQHHHAHMASCMAENGLDEPVIGVTFDGTGYGIDEETNQPVIWGGEFLVGDYFEFRRAARLRYVPMPGGDKAVEEPWRMAAAHLLDAGYDLSIFAERIVARERGTVETMLGRRFNSPLTSSAGRLFDAVAAIVGVRDRVNYEGQAAVELEWLATNVAPDFAYPFELSFYDDPKRPAVIDTRPLVRAIVEDMIRGADCACIARRFHSTMGEIVAETCRAARNTDRPLGRRAKRRGVYERASNARSDEAIVARWPAGLLPPACAAQRWRFKLGAASDCSSTKVETMMCLGIPGKVVETYREHDVLMGKVDFGGVTKRVCLEHSRDVQPGAICDRACRICTVRLSTKRRRSRYLSF